MISERDKYSNKCIVTNNFRIYVVKSQRLIPFPSTVIVNITLLSPYYDQSVYFICSFFTVQLIETYLKLIKLQ